MPDYDIRDTSGNIVGHLTERYEADWKERELLPDYLHPSAWWWVVDILVWSGTLIAALVVWFSRDSISNFGWVVAIGTFVGAVGQALWAEGFWTKEKNGVKHRPRYGYSTSARVVARVVMAWSMIWWGGLVLILLLLGDWILRAI